MCPIEVHTQDIIEPYLVDNPYFNFQYQQYTNCVHACSVKMQLACSVLTLICSSYISAICSSRDVLCHTQLAPGRLFVVSIQGTRLKGFYSLWFLGFPHLVCRQLGKLLSLPKYQFISTPSSLLSVENQLQASHGLTIILRTDFIILLIGQYFVP